MPPEPAPLHPAAARGCLPRLSYPGEFLPVLGDIETAPLIPRREIGKIDLTAHDPPPVDQAAQSSCTAASLATAIRHARLVAGGRLVDLAWSTLYGPANGGRDAGSAIDTAVNHLMRVGICPAVLGGAEYIDPFDWRGYYNGSWPDDWQTQARQYRLLEAWDCPSWDHMLSAMAHGYTGVCGVFWPGGGGHAITPVGYDPTNRRVRLLNTWSAAWGNKGYGWLDESVLLRGIPTFGGFVLRSVSIAHDDPLPPPPKP